jgi:hypothetical protein
VVDFNKHGLEVVVDHDVKPQDLKAPGMTDTINGMKTKRGGEEVGSDEIGMGRESAC